jgi:hypothetical protein
MLYYISSVEQEIEDSVFGDWHYSTNSLLELNFDGYWLFFIIQYLALKILF